MAVSQSISLTQTSQSVDSNTSTVTFKWTSTQTNDSHNNNKRTAYYYVSINGGAETKYSVEYTLTRTSTNTIVNTTLTVPHNSDGTGKISVRTWMDTRISAGVVEKSTSLTLTTIPRTSKINSFTGTDLAGSFSVSYTSYSSSFTNKLRISVPNVQALETFNYTSGAPFSLSQASLSYLYSYTENTDKVQLGVVIETYNGGTKIGESAELTHYCYVPGSIKPKVGTVQIDPVNIATKDGESRNILVKNKNKMSISVSGSTAGDGSSIKSYTFAALKDSTIVASVTTTSTSTQLGPFSQAGDLKFRVTVTDNRNRSTDNSGSELTHTCYDYSTPYLSGFNAYRANADGSQNINGTYLKCTYTQTFSPVNSTNSATVTVHYNGNTSTSTLINLGDTDSTYQVYLTIADNYGGYDKTSAITVFGQSRILNITADGTGIAIGKMAESNELFECRWPAKFNGKLTVGSSTQSSPPTSGIHIHDVRSAEIMPNSFGDQSVNFYFKQILPNDSTWYSVMHMKGWSEDYAAWELAGNAHNTLNDHTLRYRQGRGNEWYDWQTVLTNKNIYTVIYENSNGTTGTITLQHSVTNFAYLEFFLCKDAASGWWSVKVPSANGKNVQIGTQYFANTGTDTSGVGLQLIGKTITISDKTITQNSEYYINFDKSSSAKVTNAGTQQTIKIMKILGHKY